MPTTLAATFAIFAAFLAWSLPLSALAVDPVYTGFLSSTAAGGYDPVAYFEEGKAVEGSDAHVLEWNGARWRFASEENREAFRADPERYAPRYGGYCAYAVAQGTSAPGDPLAWKIVDGRLYLNLDKSIQAEWAKDIPGYIVKADQNWPGLVEGD
jgi:YHS domain-containing protein